jgi:superfamily II RNA helicase
VEKGVAFHHAGMLPTLKEVIERLFTSKLLKIIFTTETFALGINMPSRSVIFDELRKFYGSFIRNLKTRDFYQMAGRAGRRGMDQEGFVYCRVNPFRINPDGVKRVIFGDPEEVKSQLNSSYATILNLYEKHKEGLAQIYPKSFHCFQARKNEQKEATRLIEAKINLLKQSGYIENGQLTQKGMFAKTIYGYELILSELYAQGFLEQFDEESLAAISVSVVFEPRKNQRIARISKKIQKLKNICQDLCASIKDKETNFRVYPFSKPPFFHLSEAICLWLRGKSFSEVLQCTDTDEGEVVRYFRMGIQILREIRDAKVATPLLRGKVSRAINLINRDVVDAEKQLRES